MHNLNTVQLAIPTSHQSSRLWLKQKKGVRRVSGIHQIKQPMRTSWLRGDQAIEGSLTRNLEQTQRIGSSKHIKKKAHTDRQPPPNLRISHLTPESYNYLADFSKVNLQRHLKTDRTKVPPNMHSKARSQNDTIRSRGINSQSLVR